MCIVRMETAEGARYLRKQGLDLWIADPEQATGYPSHVAKDVAQCFNMPGGLTLCTAQSRELEMLKMERSGDPR